MSGQDQKVHLQAYPALHQKRFFLTVRPKLVEDV